MKHWLIATIYRWFPVGELSVDQCYTQLPGARGIRFADGTVFNYGSIKYWFLRYTHSR